MSYIQIKDKSTGRLEEATLLVDVPLRDREISQAEWNGFRALMQIEDHSESALWDWTSKGVAANEASCRCFGLRYGNQMQGLLLVDMQARPSRRRNDRHDFVLHVEYVETAPWNQPDLCNGKNRFGYVGLALMRTAVQLSIDSGCEGRLGLHSLTQAEMFYRTVGFDELFFDAEAGYPYYELSRESALSLLE